MRQVTASLALATLSLLGGCDFPTSVPRYTTEWNVPGTTTTISVNTLLPAGVSATADNSAFIATVSPSSTTIARTLGENCAACSLANGQTIPKPAFVGGGTASLTLPSSVATATLVRDTLTVTITNGFNFDPIRPSATARGYLLINVVSGSTLVGRDSIDGTTTAIPTGGTLMRKIPLSGTVSGADGIQISTTLDSPLGDPVMIDESRVIRVTGSTGPLYISSAGVSLDDQPVTASGSDVDLSDIDQTLIDHVGSGAVVLDIDNPFGVTGTLGVSLTSPATGILKTVPLAPGSTTTRIPLSGEELRSLFGYDVQIEITGLVDGSNITVTPGQTVTVESRLQLSVEVGRIGHGDNN